ncbi:MAG: hypothetical protein HRU23_16645 [Gammaproteobacteria bacterium]|nr:hypothetical protein [Gammaproteobacteria bacterium]
MSIQKTKHSNSKHSIGQTAVKPRARKCNIAKVEDFFVTTDSVVAKATVISDKSISFLEIDWGDGEKSNINIRFANHYKLPAYNGTDSLNPGTYEFYHRYPVTYEDRNDRPVPQDYFVTLRALDFNGDFDFRLKNILIEPKYKINFYSLIVGLKNQCDGGGTNEFSVVQSVSNEITNEWDWSPSDDFIFEIPTYRLDGSHLAQIFEVKGVNDSLIESVRFSFTEHDQWYDDRGSLSYSFYLSTYLTTRSDNAAGRLEGTINVVDTNPFWTASCELSYAVDWELRLVVPLPTYNGLVFSASN